MRRSDESREIRRSVASTAILTLLLGGCGHVPKVIQSSTVAACAGATTTPIHRPSWATTADIDRDGDADILLLDIRASTPAGPWAFVVPLRAQGTEFCQDAAIPAWSRPLALPQMRASEREELVRVMQLRAEDVDADGFDDLIIWNPVTHEAAVLHGTGASPMFFNSRATDPAVVLRDTDRDDHIRSARAGQALDLERADASRMLATRSSREHWNTAQVDARGRVYMTSPELIGAFEPSRRPPPSGRDRVPAPFRVDYAVYLDFTPDDAHNFGTLVVGSGARLAVQENRSEHNRWRVLQLR